MQEGRLHQCKRADCTNARGQIAPMQEGRLHQCKRADCTNALAQIEPMGKIGLFKV